VTERREMEDDLRQMAADLSEADRRKDEFLATLAHELRNPLAPLRNMLELMKRSGDDTQVLHQARDTMERQVSQMVRLVDDLLDLSRISRDKLELRMEPVELAAVLDQALEASRPLAEQAGHNLHVQLPREPVHLHADQARLAQVFSNLLNNSCKYTPEGGEIWLRAERREGDVAVTVKDNGTGIPPDKLDSIFEMFTQVDRTLERSQGGLGIGLTLVKRLVQMHGGTISVRSDGEGRGSEFEVRLPTILQPQTTEAEPAKVEPVQAESAPPPASQAPPAAASAKSAKRRRILVVDDNKDAAVSLAMLLKVSGNETHTAHDGQEALDAVERLSPEVVLLDIGLPILNGYEVCRRLRMRPGANGLVLVALTGWGQEEDRRKSHEAGFNGHLVKPVDFAQLTKLLNSLSPT
jgi:CheY-like chemotaxis protein